eukprot:Gb_40838 [translate_table: standard]
MLHFSQANFLVEGGFGFLHQGVLIDGQDVVVKRHKLANSQGDLDFYSKVEVLSCDQHRNVVMLIGYYFEDKRRLLVYEYICNGSLDSHLYGQGREPLEWYARYKIAIGTTQGLRYLHEENIASNVKRKLSTEVTTIKQGSQGLRGLNQRKQGEMQTSNTLNIEELNSQGG